ncbi:Long-chain fatty acid transport protein 4 [Eumeta japonica]|uniref:Very long-chain fatty acid transport protein n=1 Tax=Eumeta variegata TaxID=151549 RepID=A0A4C1UAZ7_EUMVA|nr:Long-chain fatty acid transport protein 4 [Eumeta japonica]
MAAIEVTVDDNMNKTDTTVQKSEAKLTNGDVEKGKVVSESGTSFSWPAVMAILGAVAVMGAACAVAWIYVGWAMSLKVFAILLIVYLFAFHWKWWYIAFRTAPRDFKALYCYIKILILTRRFNKRNIAMPDMFHEVTKKHPNKACFLFEDEIWTFKQVEEFSLRVSAALKAQGISKGHTVALFMGNYPQMPAIWLGITRVGAVAPLINTNQRGAALAHSINIAHCDAVIYADEFQSAMQDVSNELKPTLKLFKFTIRPLNTSGDAVNVVESSEGNVTDLTGLLERTPPAPWARSEGDGFQGKLLYIYTSGTTGLPKAAVISSSRMVFMASGVHYLGGLRASDVIYCPMPLYHSAGGCITMGQAMIFGCTVVLRLKFSASGYFSDCIKYKATAAHYIGEMCRYILATPPSPVDKQHRVRVMYGNGMRPQVWNDFVKRFGIKRISEFYGATEGNANIVNIDSKPGAIGFVSRIIPAVYPIAIIKVDQDTGEPIRNARGLCQLAKPHEPGVFIGKINPNNPARAYLGYVDKAASDKKVVHDVFTRGDSAFISGDILEADELGYLYFRDRTGDTFRWRGENVSTTEVEAAVSRVTDHRDAVAYGVEIPNTEGRAGMCGIVDPNGTLDLDKLVKDLRKDIPAYAQPIFIRILDSIDLTGEVPSEITQFGTFKLRKVDLQKEGFDPSKIKDNLYYLDVKSEKYLSLGAEEYQKIITGQIRL